MEASLVGKRRYNWSCRLSLNQVPCRFEWVTDSWLKMINLTFSHLFVVLPVNNATAGQDSTLHKSLAFVAWQLVCHVETQPAATTHKLNVGDKLRRYTRPWLSVETRLNSSMSGARIAKNGFLNCSILSSRLPVPGRPLHATICCVSHPDTHSKR